MSQSPPKDKRRHPRVTRRIRVRSDLREAVELETIDLSAGGLSCTAPVYLAPMTKMALSLVLPGSPNPPDHVVRGEAVVVRTEPATPGVSVNGLYRVALFFSRMDDADRRILQEYLKTLNGKSGNA